MQKSNRFSNYLSQLVIIGATGTMIGPRGEATSKVWAVRPEQIVDDTKTRAAGHQRASRLLNEIGPPDGKQILRRRQSESCIPLIFAHEAFRRFARRSVPIRAAWLTWAAHSRMPPAADILLGGLAAYLL